MEFEQEGVDALAGYGKIFQRIWRFEKKVYCIKRYPGNGTWRKINFRNSLAIPIYISIYE